MLGHMSVCKSAPPQHGPRTRPLLHSLKSGYFPRCTVLTKGEAMSRLQLDQSNWARQFYDVSNIYSNLAYLWVGASNILTVETINCRIEWRLLDEMRENIKWRRMHTNKLNATRCLHPRRDISNYWLTALSRSR